MAVKTNKVVKVDLDGFVALTNFESFLDIRKVKYYSIRDNKDKSLLLKFYDKNRKLIKLNELK